MVRVKRGVTHHARHKKILALTKGHSGGRHRLYKTAKESMVHALAYQYRDRRNRKRDFRRLWIQRINAGARLLGMSYSRLIDALKTGDIEINRKMLAELALNDPSAFESLVRSATSPVEATLVPRARAAVATAATLLAAPEAPAATAEAAPQVSEPPAATTEGATDTAEAPAGSQETPAPRRRRRAAPSA